MDTGRAVRLDAPAQRIVSLSPSTTELLFAIGAGDRVVGRTRWCADPPEALAVESVGDGLDPNVELIVARRPDLVVFYRSGMNDAAIAQLERLGIATASVQLDGLADLTRAALLLGRLTGDSARADTLVRVFEQELSAVSTPPLADAASVLILAWDNPPIVIGSASFLSEIVSHAGARNAFADLEHPSGSVSLEAIAARAPEVVLLTEGDAEPAFARRPEWQVVKGVREGRFVAVSGSQFSHPSFRAALAIAELRAALEGWRR
jgi:iron complex transport system substrate-binding protein